MTQSLLDQTPIGIAGLCENYDVIRLFINKLRSLIASLIIGRKIMGLIMDAVLQMAPKNRETMELKFKTATQAINH